MKAYLVEANGRRKYFGTQADVATHKRELLATGLHRKDIAVKEVEIPTGKAELLKFINNEAGQPF